MQYNFTFKTDKELRDAELSGFDDSFDIVRVSYKTPTGDTYDIPLKSEEEYQKFLNSIIPQENKIEKFYQDKHGFDHGKLDYLNSVEENKKHMKNKMSLVEFKNYIKIQAQKLLKIETLKEEKEKLEKELSILSEKKYNPWAVCHASTGPEKGEKFEKCVMDVKKKQGMDEIEKTAMDAAKKDIEDSGEKFTPLGKSKFEKHLDKKELRKAMSPEKLNEALNEKGIALIQKQMTELGARQTAIKLVDYFIKKTLGGMTASDLPDSATYANGLDEIESILENSKDKHDSNDYNTAFQIAKETAQEMISEEGGEGLF